MQEIQGFCWTLLTLEMMYFWKPYVDTFIWKDTVGLMNVVQFVSLRAKSLTRTWAEISIVSISMAFVAGNGPSCNPLIFEA